jgi:hypothetical protein
MRRALRDIAEGRDLDDVTTPCDVAAAPGSRPAL